MQERDDEYGDRRQCQYQNRPSQKLERHDDPLHVPVVLLAIPASVPFGRTDVPRQPSHHCPNGERVSIAAGGPHRPDRDDAPAAGKRPAMNHARGDAAARAAADDYVTRPFSLREARARMRAVMRRAGLSAGASPQAPVTRGKHPRAHRFAGWTLNLNSRRPTSPDDQAIVPTHAGFDLPVVRLSTPVRILSREPLRKNTRALDDIDGRAIGVQIPRLRRKPEADPAGPTLLRAGRGAGDFPDADIEPLWN
ncbi:hypothetical protein [Paraburkholderia caballeronis]|nr:hypothetical protein [Paraburkholderia caballeronis]